MKEPTDFGEARVQPVSVSSGQHEQTIHFSEFPDTAEDEQEHEKVSPWPGKVVVITIIKMK